MREVKVLTEEHTSELVGAYLDKNLGLLILSPEVFQCHYLSHTSRGKKPQIFTFI